MGLGRLFDSFPHQVIGQGHCLRICHQILFRLAAAKGAGATVFPFIDYRYLRPAWLSAVIQKYADVPEPTTIESNVLFVIFVPKLESDPCEMSSPVCVPIPYSVFPTVL